MSLLTLQDEIAFTADGRTMFRLVNASPDVPALDFYVNGGRGDPVRTGEVPLFSDVRFGTASDFTNVAAGTYDIEVRPTMSSTVVYTATGVTLNDNSVYTLYALGRREGTPAFRVVPHLDSVSPANLRLAHALIGLGPVDVLLDDHVILSNTVPFSTSGYLDLEPGTHTLTIVPAGATTPVIVSTTLNLVAATDYTLVTAGGTDNAQAVLLTDEEALPAWGKALIRFVHASPSAPMADVAIAGGSSLFEPIAFGNATPYVQLEPGTFTLQVRQAGTGAVMLTVPDVTLAGGHAYTFFLMGENDG